MTERALTLHRRRISRSLGERHTNPVATVTVGGSLVANMILQGFSATAAFDTTAFLLYGLYSGGNTTTYSEPGLLTLRRRPISLEVA